MITLAQGIYGGKAAGAPWYVSLAITVFPWLLAVVLTNLFVRFQRSFAFEDREPYTKRQTFWLTLKAGAVFGLICVGTTFGTVNYFIGLPVMWELLLLAAASVGLLSMGAYETARWWMARKINDGKKHWNAAYDWLSLTKQRKNYYGWLDEPIPDEGPRTQMAPEDPTDPK